MTANTNYQFQQEELEKLRTVITEELENIQDDFQKEMARQFINNILSAEEKPTKRFEEKLISILLELGLDLSQAFLFLAHIEMSASEKVVSRLNSAMTQKQKDLLKKIQAKGTNQFQNYLVLDEFAKRRFKKTLLKLFEEELIKVLKESIDFLQQLKDSAVVLSTLSTKDLEKLRHYLLQNRVFKAMELINNISNKKDA